jgi:hypothetical protein
VEEKHGGTQVATATATARPALKRSRDQQDRSDAASVKRAATRPATEQAAAVAGGSAARLFESRFTQSLAPPTPLQPEANGSSLPPPFPPSFAAIVPTALSSSTPASAAIAAVPAPSEDGPVTVPDQYRRGDLVVVVDSTDEALDSDSDPSGGIDDSDDEDNDDDDNDDDALPPAKRARREPTTSDTDPANPTETGGRRSPGYVVCRLAESVESLLPDDYRALVKVSSHVRDGVWRFRDSNRLVLKSSLLCRLHPVPVKTTTTATTATTAAMVDTIAPGREEGSEVVRLSASTRSLVAQLLADRQATSS